MNKLIFATVVLASCNSDRESLLAMSCYVCVVAVIVVVFFFFEPNTAICLLLFWKSLWIKRNVWFSFKVF